MRAPPDCLRAPYLCMLPLSWLSGQQCGQYRQARAKLPILDSKTVCVVCCSGW
jgi:hypothetical protein